MAHSPICCIVLLSLVGSCTASGASAEPSARPAQVSGAAPVASISLSAPLTDGQADAVFAGGCFWCMETAFEGVEGVLSSVSGYTAGHVDNPSYDQVSGGGTGHYEAVRVVYDPKRISYAHLLDIFLHNIDPTQGDGQFCDHGPQYRSAIFAQNATQRAQARSLLARAHTTLNAAIATEVLKPSPFFVAESYHQDYFRTHAAHYQAYRKGCGRDARLRTLWGAASGGH